MLSKFKEHLEETNLHYRLIRRKSLRKGKIRNIKRKMMKRKSCPESQTRREGERERERDLKSRIKIKAIQQLFPLSAADIKFKMWSLPLSNWNLNFIASNIISLYKLNATGAGLGGGSYLKKLHSKWQFWDWSYWNNFSVIYSIL